MHSTHTLSLPVSVTQQASAAQESFESRSPVVPSSALLQGRKAVEISHNGSLYRLQATKLGKLILTK